MHHTYKEIWIFIEGLRSFVMIKNCYKKVLLSFFVFWLPLCAQHITPQPRILVGSPVRQKPAILKEFLESLERLTQQNYSLEYFFIDDNESDASSVMLQKFLQDHAEKCIVLDMKRPDQERYICNETTHFWGESLIWKVAAFKDVMIDYARKNNYSHLFLIDSDLILHPNTIDQLLSAKKDIIAEIFWTQWTLDSPEQPQVWMSDFYNQYASEIGEKLTNEEISRRVVAFYKQLKTPGIYEVGGLGACTLITKHALDCGVSFKRIKNILLWGEDRHFCVRAAALGLSLFVDTHYPAYHIYRESLLPGVDAFKRSCMRGQRITLSMIVKNEGGRYLKKVLQAAKAYITDAVIIDDASTDDTVAICREILHDIPLIMVHNKESKFSNEVALRKQQWEETIKTNPDWILSLDADEIFEAKFSMEVHELIKNPDVDAYYFRLYDMWDEEKYRDDALWCAHKVWRPFLIRYNPSVEYTWKETPQHCGRFPLEIYQFSYQTTQLRLKHYGWADENDRRAKYIRYQELDPNAIYGVKEQYESILDVDPHCVLWIENAEE